MFKILLTIHKESLALVIAVVVTVLLIVVNVAVVVPTLISVYSSSQEVSTLSPIDVTSVNKALEYLPGEN